MVIAAIKKDNGEVPWWSSGWDSTLSLPRAGVQSLVQELRSLKLHGQKKKKKKERWWAGDWDPSVADEDMEMNEQVSIFSTINSRMDAFTQGQLLH